MHTNFYLHTSQICMHKFQAVLREVFFCFTFVTLSGTQWLSLAGPMWGNNASYENKVTAC